MINIIFPSQAKPYEKWKPQWIKRPSSYPASLSLLTPNPFHPSPYFSLPSPPLSSRSLPCPPTHPSQFPSSVPLPPRHQMREAEGGGDWVRAENGAGRGLVNIIRARKISYRKKHIRRNVISLPPEGYVRLHEMHHFIPKNLSYYSWRKV